MKQEYKIGNLKIESRVFLAPMLEYNDLAFRELCKKAGAGLCWTGMINPLSGQKFDFSDKPAIQLFCNNEKGVDEFVRKHDSQAAMWDFNLGCPSKKAGNCKIGGFMQDLVMIEKILKIIRENTDKPVTIKVRKSKNAFKLVKIAEKYCQAICIHPRTREQYYSGEPDINFAEKIKKKNEIPIIYSGNVDENNVADLLKKFDFVMIGRKAMGNPNIFSKINSQKTSYDFSDYLNLAIKHKIEFSQIKIQAMVFTKGKNNASDVREKITHAKTIREIEKIMAA